MSPDIQNIRYRVRSGQFDKQLAEIPDRAVRRSPFDAMRPAALAAADGPVGAVEHGSEFFNGIERPKRGGSQRTLQAVPICRRQRILHPLDGAKGTCASAVTHNAGERSVEKRMQCSLDLVRVVLMHTVEQVTVDKSANVVGADSDRHTNKAAPRCRRSRCRRWRMAATVSDAMIISLRGRNPLQYNRPGRLPLLE
jgi:hypothetical protein